MLPSRVLYNSMPFVCQGSTAAQPWRKSNAIVSFFRPAVAVNRYTFQQVAKLCASARYTGLVLPSRSWLITVCCFVAQRC
jgi:hypothetical protein